MKEILTAFTVFGLDAAAKKCTDPFWLNKLRTAFDNFRGKAKKPLRAISFHAAGQGQNDLGGQQRQLFGAEGQLLIQWLQNNVV